MIANFFIFTFLVHIIICAKSKSIADTLELKKSDPSVIYNQQQTGKYNIKLDIHDVQFFSLSDSIGSIGDYSDYGDYGAGGDDYELPDYDNSHLTVNPIFAFLGSTTKPTTKPSQSTTVDHTLASNNINSSLPLPTNVVSAVTQEPLETSTNAINSTEQDSGMKDSAMYIIKPASNEIKKPLVVNETIDYEEIPVEVQYYRANQKKVPTQTHGKHASNRFKKRPSVQIIDGRKNNVKILEEEQQIVPICGRGMYRDNFGRCRLRSRRNENPGL